MSDRMVKAALFDGAEPGRTVGVTDGRLQTDASGSTVSPGATGTTTLKDAVGTTSTDVAAANSKRVQFTLQNVDPANSIYLRLMDDSSNAGVDDLRIDPGVLYSLPAGVSYTGKIKLKGAAANTKVVLVEFLKP